MKKRILIYVRTIAVPVIIGAAVGLIMNSSIDYEVLKNPPYAPPSIAFPIVWTILYIMMGISHGILIDKKLMNNNLSILYYLQLGVNALWSIIFFVLKMRALAIVWILLLLALITVMIIKMYDKNKFAGLIQVPYFLWVNFATYLTVAFFVLNINS